MPPARCKFYTEDGTPVGQGCGRRAACQFVHPDQAAWDRAPPSRHAASAHGRPPTTSPTKNSASASRNTSKSSSGWGETSSGRGVSSGWGDAGWGQSSTGVWPSDWAPSGTSGQGTGAHSSWGAAAAGSSSKSKSSQPNKADNEQFATDTQSKPLASGSLGWGSSGWSSSDGAASANKPAIPVPTWDVPSSLGEQTVTEWDRAQLLKKRKMSISTTSRFDQKQDGSSSAMDVDAASSGLPAPAPPSSAPAAKLPPKMPRALARRLSERQPEKAREQPTEARPLKRKAAPPPERPPSPSGTDTTSSTARRTSFVSSARILNPREVSAKDKQTVETIIRSSMQAVAAKYEYKDAQAQRESFRRARASETYAHITMATREKFERIAEELRVREDESRVQYEKALGALIGQPVLESAWVGLEMRRVAEEASLYMSEIKEWQEDLRPRLMVLTAPPKPQPAPSPPTDDPALEDPPPPEADLHSLTLKYNGCRANLYNVEERINNLENNIDPVVRYTNLLDTTEDTVDEKRTAKLAAATASRREVGRALLLEKLDPLGARSQQVGDDVAAQSEPVAGAIIKGAENNETVDRLQGKVQQLRASYEEWLEHSNNTAKSLREAQEEARHAREETQALLAAHAHAAAPAPPPAPSADAILEALVPVVRGIVLADVQPVLEALHDMWGSQIKQHHQQLYAQVWKLLQPTLDLSRDVSVWMEERKGATNV